MNRFPYISSSPRLPALRCINAVVVLTRIAARYGIGADALLDGSGIDPADLDDPQKLITTIQETSIGRRLLRLVPVPWIGLEVGREYHFSANGKLGMAMMCCETLLDAVKLAMAFIQLTASYHQYSIRIEGDVGYARMRELMELGEFRRFICEAETASIHSMACHGHEEKTIFRELRFAYPDPGYASRYADLFGCPVRFGAPEHMIVFDARHLFQPLTFANPLLKKALEKDCRQQVLRLEEHETVAARIYQELSLQPGRFPTFGQLARRINLSPRTMRRRLMEERTSYKAILADIRKNRAVELIRTTRLPMAQVALHLGFNEVSSFYRAFKSWTGRTPSSYRSEGL